MLSEENYRKQLLCILEKLCVIDKDGSVWYQGNFMYNLCYDNFADIVVVDVEQISYSIIGRGDNSEEVYHLKEIINAYYFGLKFPFFERMSDNIDQINDNIQTFAEVTNLFADVDKNRNSLEDKLNKLEQSTNNRLDNLEASINQIISMLQKS